jgi:hypothetical protein
MLGLGNSIVSGAALGDLASEIAAGNLAVLPSIEHWFKYNTGITHNAGSPDFKVTQWDDQISSKHWLASADHPVYDSTTGALKFNGASKVMITTDGTTADIELDGNFAVYLRIKFATTPSSSDIFFKDASSSNNFLRANSATVIRAKITSGSLNWTVPTMGTSAYHNIGIERSGSDVRVYLDGTESETGAITASNTWNIDTLKGGLDDLFKTLIIVKGEALTADTRPALNTYLDTL